jgi:hypothetical protein
VSVDARANITGIRFETHEFGTDRTSHQPVSSEIRIREFTPGEIAADHGVVLDGVPGHDAVMLQGQIVAGTTTAALAIRYLHNGFTGEFRQCDVMLDRGQGGDWHLVTAQNRAVPPLVVVKTWGLPLIGTVGIETLQGICAGD